MRIGAEVVLVGCDDKTSGSDNDVALVDDHGIGEWEYFFGPGEHCPCLPWLFAKSEIEGYDHCDDREHENEKEKDLFLERKGLGFSLVWQGGQNASMAFKGKIFSRCPFATATIQVEQT